MTIASRMRLPGVAWLLFLVLRCADAQDATGCPGEAGFPEAALFLETAGYPADDYAVLLAWQEPIPADEAGEMIHGYRLQPRAGGAPFDVYSDEYGFLLNQEVRSALGINEKNWDLRPVETATESRPPTIRAARTVHAPVRAASGLASSGTAGFLPLDMAAVREADRVRDSVSGAKPRRIGVFRDFPEPVTVAGAECSVGTWQTLDGGGYLWSIDLCSAEAKGLRVHFQEMRLPSGAHLAIFNPEDPAEFYGPLSPPQTAADGFWSPTCFAETVAIECYLPEGEVVDSVVLVIDRLAHIYERLGDLPWAKAAGSCNLDVTCYPGWGTEATSVGGLGTIGADGALWCTGTLLADTDPATDIPYFMAADHCTGSQYTANSLEIYWLYQTPACNGSPPNPATVPRTTGGADYLAGSTADGGTDFAFLRLRNAPPAGVAFAGWTSSPASVGTDALCIHHPSGDFKRISFGLVTDIADTLRASRPIERFHQVQWAQGTTEGGSSGSPLIRYDSGQFIGQLWGGKASCLTPLLPDYYGRFDVTFPLVEAWLDPADSALSVLPANQYAAATGGTTSFTIDNAGWGTRDWSAEVVVGSGWLSISSSSSGTTPATLEVSYDTNTDSSSRTGYIEVTDATDGSVVVVGVVQAAATTPILSVEPSSREVPATSGSTTFAVSNTGLAGMSWTASIVAAADWLYIASGANGTDDGTVTVAFEANALSTSRSAEMEVVAPGALDSPASVTVVQEACSAFVLSVTPSTQAVASTGGTVTLAVSGIDDSTAWTAAVGPASGWLAIVSGSSGTGPGAIVVSCQTMTGCEARTGSIIVNAPGATNSPFTVAVEQDRQAPAAPSGVAASDGTHTDYVRITWNPVVGAVSYRVYRGDVDDFDSATYVGKWYDTVADDYSVAAEANGEDTGGCTGDSSGNGSSIHYYWVTAVDACRESDPSSSDSGYAGTISKASAAATGPMPNRASSGNALLLLALPLSLAGVGAFNKTGNGGPAFPGRRRT